MTKHPNFLVQGTRYTVHQPFITLHSKGPGYFVKSISNKLFGAIYIIKSARDTRIDERGQRKSGKRVMLLRFRGDTEYIVLPLFRYPFFTFHPGTKKNKKSY